MHQSEEKKTDRSRASPTIMPYIFIVISLIFDTIDLFHCSNFSWCAWEWKRVATCKDGRSLVYSMPPCSKWCKADRLWDTFRPFWALCLAAGFHSRNACCSKTCLNSRQGTQPGTQSLNLLLLGKRKEFQEENHLIAWTKALHLFIVQRELLGDEMPATGTSQALLMAYEKAKKPVSRAQRWVNIVTALSTAAIIVRDFPGHWSWLDWLDFSGWYLCGDFCCGGGCEILCALPTICDLSQALSCSTIHYIIV